MNRFRDAKTIFIFITVYVLSWTALGATTNSQKSSVYKVKSGDTVFSILRRHGFNENNLKAALSQNPIPKSHVLSEDAIYRAGLDRGTGLYKLKFYSKDRPEAFVFWRGASSAGAKKERVRFDTQTVTASGRVRGSLVESLTQAIGDELVAYRFMDAFLLDYPNLPKLLQRNADFSLKFEKLYEDGQFIRHGEVLRAEIEIDGQMVARQFKRLQNGGTFVNTRSNYGERPFYSPVNYIRFSSLFQPRRFHPIQKFKRAHLGIDFELPEGAPIHAISGGSVLRIGRNRAAGNFIVLKHNNGYESYYNHMRSMARLETGQKVAAGDFIGEIGCTGYCTKPHLHFAIKHRGAFVNPISLIRNYSYIQKAEINSLWPFKLTSN